MASLSAELFIQIWIRSLLVLQSHMIKEDFKEFNLFTWQRVLNSVDSVLLSAFVKNINVGMFGFIRHKEEIL